MDAPRNVAIEKEVVAFINSKFSSLETLKTAKNLQLMFEKRVSDIKTLSSQPGDAGEATAHKCLPVEDLLHKAEELVQSTSDLESQLNGLYSDIASQQAESQEVADQLSTMVDKINEMKKVTCYIKVVARIEGYSSDIQSALVLEATDKALEIFERFSGFVQTLLPSKCSNLVQFVKETLKFWLDIFKTRFASEFEEILEAFHWPFVTTTLNEKPIPNAQILKSKLPDVFRNLLRLNTPYRLVVAPTQAFADLISDEEGAPILLPILLMLKPLRKRFLYHFQGKKQTNRIDRPEWFFTQVLSWIKDHEDFLKTKIQPLLRGTDYEHTDVVVEFSRSLVLMCMDKLQQEMTQYLDSEKLFCHLLDECLRFTRDLHGAVGNCPHLPNCLDLLVQDGPFQKWLALENKNAAENLDGILSSPTAWQYQITDSQEEEIKIPECAYNFITLLTAITDRYRALRHTENRLHFVSLQVELLEDFRLRVVQVKNEQAKCAIDPLHCAAINTIYYVVQVLKDWADWPFFVELQLFRSRLSLDMIRYQQNKKQSEQHGEEDSLSGVEATGSVFDPVVQLYEHLYREMLNSTTKYITDDVTARTQPYRKDQWLSLPSQREFIALSLSASACEMLMVLRDRLLLVETSLSQPLFTTCWQNIAATLNTYLFEELILTNYFNEGGAAQLHYDMFRNLFPLFNNYTKRPENYFKDVKEACILLTLAPGSAILLKDVLYEALHKAGPSTHAVSDPVAALHDIGVYKLSLEQAQLVLSKRADIGRK